MCGNGFFAFSRRSTAASDLTQSAHAVVDDGLPFDGTEHRRDTDRQIGKHEQREGEGVKHLLRGGAVDILPLGGGGNRSDDEHHEIRVKYELAEGQQEYIRSAAGKDAVYPRADVYKQAEQREHHGGSDVHCHVKAGEAVIFEYALYEAAAVAPEYLDIAPCPAHTLPPGL